MKWLILITVLIAPVAFGQGFDLGKAISDGQTIRSNRQALQQGRAVQQIQRRQPYHNPYQAQQYGQLQPSPFCVGFREGFINARCQGQSNCLKPLTPVCPLAPVGKDTYAGGYHTGFLRGLH